MEQTKIKPTIDPKQSASPNMHIRPLTAAVNDKNHLVIGGVDMVVLAEQFGTPLWVIDEETVRRASTVYQKMLSDYPRSRVHYAGKAFMCLAMCKLAEQLGLGLDVVSLGELHTARQADFPGNMIFFHGNNKLAGELNSALDVADLIIVVDNLSELNLLIDLARKRKQRASILLRVNPNVEPDTHHHIQTGPGQSKFGINLFEFDKAIETCLQAADAVNLLGLHAHIGSYVFAISEYLSMIDVLADLFLQVKTRYNLSLPIINVGGGLGIILVAEKQPASIEQWTQAIVDRVKDSFSARNLELPELVIEPGRSIIGSAGVTLYRAGHAKSVDGGKRYLALDGGMADNPRPITYDAAYTACIANRVENTPTPEPITLAGSFCEQGDIIIKETFLPAQTGDLIAVFGTGAYNYSQSSNYNRTARPACVLVKDGVAEIIIERETLTDLLRNDRIPPRLVAIPKPM